MLIYVTVKPENENVPLQNKTALRIESIEEAEEVAKEFAKETANEFGFPCVNYEIFIKINGKFYKLVESSKTEDDKMIQSIKLLPKWQQEKLAKLPGEKEIVIGKSGQKFVIVFGGNLTGYHLLWLNSDSINIGRVYKSKYEIYNELKYL